MKSEPVVNLVSGLVEYRLMNDDQCVAGLKYNPLQHSFRIQCDGMQRVFFMQHTGFLKSKIIITDEYGLEAGKIGLDKWYGNSYTVEVRGKKYHVAHESNPSDQLSVYARHTAAPIASCSLQADTGDTQLLVFALCWFVGMPVTLKAVSKAN